MSFRSLIQRRAKRKGLSASYRIQSAAASYQVPFLVDFPYTFHPGPKLTPYVVVGGGGVYMRMHLQSLSGLVFDADSSETDWAVQAMAGLRLRVHEGGELGLGYKFLATFPSLNDDGGMHSLSREYTLHFRKARKTENEERGQGRRRIKEEQGKL